MESLKSYLPAIVRYAVVSVSVALATRGVLSPESSAIIGQHIDVIVSALVGLSTVVYALVIRPSAKAMEVAKEVDAKVPAGSPVVIKTPPGVDDIIVSGDKK